MPCHIQVNIIDLTDNFHFEQRMALSIYTPTSSILVGIRADIQRLAGIMNDKEFNRAKARVWQFLTHVLGQKRSSHS